MSNLRVVSVLKPGLGLSCFGHIEGIEWGSQTDKACFLNCSLTDEGFKVVFTSNESRVTFFTESLEVLNCVCKAFVFEN